MSCGRFVALTLVVAACALGNSAQAQQTTNAGGAHFDWTGYYTIAGGADLQGFVPVNPDLNPVVTAHLRPWARLRLEATDGVADDNGQTCQPVGLFRYWVTQGGFSLLAGPDRIWFVSSQINTSGVRRIFLNRDHPKNLPPTFNGHSVGHWDGETLVVDTIGFNDKAWLAHGMQPHTEELHLVERMRPVGDGSLLEVQAVVSDRHALTSAYTYTRYYKKTDLETASKMALPLGVCNEDPKVWKEIRDASLVPAIERSREVR